MRMRTMDQAYAELHAADPRCALAKTALRRMVVSGRIPSVRVGPKYLLDIDRLEEYLFTPEKAEAPVTSGGMRRLEARI